MLTNSKKPKTDEDFVDFWLCNSVIHLDVRLKTRVMMDGCDW